MGRPSNASARRAQIVEATVRVMARAGFDGASVQAIASEAGLSAGLVHHHFSSKAEILHALPEHLEALLQARLERLSTREAGAWGRLDAWIDAHLDLGDGAHPDAAAAWVWLGAHALKDSRLRELYRDVVERRRATLERLLRDVAREQRVSIDAVALSVTTLATIEGYYQLAASTDLVPTGSAARSLRDTLRRLLDPEPRR